MGSWDDIFNDTEEIENDSFGEDTFGNDDMSDDINDSFDDDNSADTKKKFSLNIFKNTDDGKKTDLKIIVIGMILVGVAIIVGVTIRKIDSNKNKVKTEKKTETSVSVVNNTTNYSDSNSVSNKSTVASEWSEFSGYVDITEINTVELTFTVTDVKYYVRQISEKEIELRSEISGAISGLSGTYNVDVDFSLMNGKSIDIGKTFLVEVTLGKYDGRTVVTDVKVK